MLKDYLQLHFIVFIWGFTAVLGVLIQIPATEVVFFRTGIASFCLALVMIASKRKLFPGLMPALIMMGIGAIIGIHWILFFTATEVSNASITLAGLSTCAFWTSLIAPLFTKSRIRMLEVSLGILVLAGLYLIFMFEFDHTLGLILSLLAAILSSLFSIFTSKISHKYDAGTITFYQMLGACAITVIFFPIYTKYFTATGTLALSPSGEDWFYLLILAVLCTVYPYIVTTNLLKRITPFAMNLTINLEPIYGISLAILMLGENDKLNAGFYSGGLLIFLSVMAYPVINFIKSKTKKKEIKLA